MTRLVVIGAGPAGLSAAVEAAKHDVSVTVVDEGPRPGGRLLGQLHHEPGKGWWIDAAITFLPHIRTGRARLAEMWSAREAAAA